MRADAVVVDASALAAFLFGEPDGPGIAGSLEGRALFAPTLIRYELASVCLKKATVEPEKEEKLLVALGLYDRLGVQEVQVPGDGLVEMARASRLTAYDAAYLCLARELGAELLTLDRRLSAARGRLAGRPGR